MAEQVKEQDTIISGLYVRQSKKGTEYYSSGYSEKFGGYFTLFRNTNTEKHPDAIGWLHFNEAPAPEKKEKKEAKVKGTIFSGE